MVTLTHETEERYNAVCAAAYLRINRLSQNKHYIDLTGIDPELKSHKMVVSLAKAYGGIVSKKVRLDMKRTNIKSFNAGLDKDCCFLRLPFTARKGAIAANEIVEAMREVAAKVSPNSPISLDEIYDAFWEENK